MGGNNPPGHGLAMYGNPFDGRGRPASIYTNRGWAKCKCGEMSPEYASQAERRQWHRDHKQAVLDAAEESK